MFQNNPLLAQLKQQLHSQTPRVEGVVKGTEKGYGFLEVDANTRYFIPPAGMRKVMHGDRITATLQKEKEREIAEPESLVEPFLSRFVAHIQKKENDNRLFVIPDHPLIKDYIPARPVKTLNHAFQQGDWIIAEMRRHPLVEQQGFRAEIVDFITTAEDPFIPWWVTLAKLQLEKEAPTGEVFPLLDEEIERHDLTHLPFITIDSPQTEDMDDALYITESDSGEFTLMVAIADPGAYIAADSALDLAAKQRGFTNYLPGFNIPMLPRELSDNLCSLRPNERRPALVCRLTVHADGTLSDNGEFLAAWITSKARLNYNDVSDWLENKGEWRPEHEETAQLLTTLNHYTDCRQQWRQQHSLLFKEHADYRFILDEQNHVVDIVIEQRRKAHKMVEEAMIAANISAAKVLRDTLGYGVFNTHQGFDPNQIESVVATLHANGVERDADALLTLPGFCELRRFLDTQETTFLDGRMRRYQSIAEITTQPAPHFGLGLDVYATWTSPIRKYGDIVNHRLLKATIAKQQISPPTEEIAQHLSERRRLNRIAEREVSDWLYVDFLQRQPEAALQYDAEIVDISRGGMRVRLLSIGAMAFIPASFIHPVREELTCSQENGIIQLKGEVLYRLNDHLTVHVTEIRKKTRSIIAKPVKE